MKKFRIAIIFSIINASLLFLHIVPSWAWAIFPSDTDILGLYYLYVFVDAWLDIYLLLALAIGILTFCYLYAKRKVPKTQIGSSLFIVLFLLTMLGILLSIFTVVAPSMMEPFATPRPFDIAKPT